MGQKVQKHLINGGFYHMHSRFFLICIVFVFKNHLAPFIIALRDELKLNVKLELNSMTFNTLERQRQTSLWQETRTVATPLHWLDSDFSTVDSDLDRCINWKSEPSPQIGLYWPEYETMFVSFKYIWKCWATLFSGSWQLHPRRLMLQNQQPAAIKSGDLNVEF